MEMLFLSGQTTPGQLHLREFIVGQGAKGATEMKGEEEKERAKVSQEGLPFI